MRNKVNNAEFISRSPLGKDYKFCKNFTDVVSINEFIKRNRNKKIVVIQGLGFVGSAMLTVVANARNRHNSSRYAVIGVDLALPSTYWKVGMIKDGRFPIKSADRQLSSVFTKAFKSGNILATTDKYAYRLADIIIIDINLGVEKHSQGDMKKADVNFTNFIFAVKEIAMNMRPDCLIIVESTVPVGTCEKILLPLFNNEFRKRGYDNFKVNLAHSYERVMPGKGYLKSITSYFRVFSGIDKKSKKKAKKFLETIIDTYAYPLTELHSTTASEMGKILENSFRAVNIAFIQEWTEFAHRAEVNLFEVIAAIRKRDTHRNIMLPGFGVGGFCLPKDSLLGNWSARRLFGSPKHLDFSINAVKTNDRMPLYSFDLLKKHLIKRNKKRILLMGISYLKDVADTRYSPSEIFYRQCQKSGVEVILHDPIVSFWNEMGLEIKKDLKLVKDRKVDAIVLALNHSQYRKMNPRDFSQLLKPKGLILDCNDVVCDKKAAVLKNLGYKIIGVGKGHWTLKRNKNK